MKYLCLIYLDERKIAAMPTDEAEALWSESVACERRIRATDGYLAAAELEPTRVAITVRRRSGSIHTTDGPFAETREQLGGFVLIDAFDLDEAIRIAASVPAARLGSVEVRPVRDLHSQTATPERRIRLVAVP